MQPTNQPNLKTRGVPIPNMNELKFVDWVYTKLDSCWFDVILFDLLQALENFSDAPMTPKQILHVIQTKGLKEMRSSIKY